MKPTPRQRKAAKAIIDNLQNSRPKSVGKVLEDVGYGQIVKSPGRIIESIGFKQALAELGLTEDLITTSLVNDIHDKPKNRIQELKLGAEILGMVKRDPEPQDKPQGNTYNFIFSEKIQSEIRKTDEMIKAQLIKPYVQEN